MEKEKISIIIPVFNVAEYLSKCLDSIIQQTYRNIEIILVDDGSTDSCLQICNDYAIIDERITVIHQKNAGLSAARNSGINIASGQFITFVDSDDIVDKDMIEYLYRMLREQDADMSLCQMRRINEGGQFIDNPPTVKSFVVGDTPEKCLKAFFQSPNFDTVAWSKLYKSSLFSKIRFPIGKFHEDVFTTYKVVSKCHRIVVGEKRKYFYRVRQESIMNLPFRPSHMDALEGKLEVNAFIEKSFPSLSRWSYLDILYAANMCTLRIAKCYRKYPEYVAQLQSVYRKYTIRNLKNKGHFNLKIFSLIAFFNLRFLIYIIRFTTFFKNK